MVALFVFVESEAYLSQGRLPNRERLHVESRPLVVCVQVCSVSHSDYETVSHSNNETTLLRRLNY